MLKFLSRLTDSNEREVRRFEPTVARINELEPEFSALSDAELRAKTDEFRARLRDSLGDLLIPIEQRPLTPEEAAESELVVGDPTRISEERKEQHRRERREIDTALDEILPEAFAAVREAMRRALAKRHYDVQLVGGMVLHAGAIAEMKTGEGKTLVATLPCVLNALSGRGVHVVTVNDYLARRDSEWMGRLHHFLGLSTGVRSVSYWVRDFGQEQAGTPLFMHFAYAVVLVLVAVCLLVRRERVLLTLAVCALLYLASYSVVGIACDFRYVYALTVTTTLLLAYACLNCGTPRTIDASASRRADRSGRRIGAENRIA